MAKVCPRWLAVGLVGLLVVANTINIAADIGAIAEAARLLAGGPTSFTSPCLGGSIATRIWFSYERTVGILKWLTMVLFAYVAELGARIHYHSQLQRVFSAEGDAGAALAQIERARALAQYRQFRQAHAQSRYLRARLEQERLYRFRGSGTGAASHR